MNALDLLFVAILLFGFIRGARRGIILELSGLMGILVSLYIAKYFAGWVGELISSLITGGVEFSPIVTFVITFLLAMIAVHFLAIQISRIINNAMLGWVNRLAGGLFSLLKFLLIMSALLSSFDWMNRRIDLVDQQLLEPSRLYEPIRDSASVILPFFHIDDLIQSVKNADAVG